MGGDGQLQSVCLLSGFAAPVIGRQCLDTHQQHRSGLDLWVQGEGEPWPLSPPLDLLLILYHSSCAAPHRIPGPKHLPGAQSLLGHQMK